MNLKYFGLILLCIYDITLCFGVRPLQQTGSIGPNYRIKAVIVGHTKTSENNSGIMIKHEEDQFTENANTHRRTRSDKPLQDQQQTSTVVSEPLQIPVGDENLQKSLQNVWNKMNEKLNRTKTNGNSHNSTVPAYKLTLFFVTPSSENSNAEKASSLQPEALENSEHYDYIAIGVDDWAEQAENLQKNAMTQQTASPGNVNSATIVTLPVDFPAARKVSELSANQGHSYVSESTAAPMNLDPKIEARSMAQTDPQMVPGEKNKRGLDSKSFSSNKEINSSISGNNSAEGTVISTGVGQTNETAADGKHNKIAIHFTTPNETKLDFLSLNTKMMLTTKKQQDQNDLDDFKTSRRSGNVKSNFKKAENEKSSEEQAARRMHGLPKLRQPLKTNITVLMNPTPSLQLANRAQLESESDLKTMTQKPETSISGDNRTDPIKTLSPSLKSEIESCVKTFIDEENDGLDIFSRNFSVYLPEVVGNAEEQKQITMLRKYLSRPDVIRNVKISHFNTLSGFEAFLEILKRLSRSKIVRESSFYPIISFYLDSAKSAKGESESEDEEDESSDETWSTDFSLPSVLKYLVNFDIDSEVMPSETKSPKPLVNELKDESNTEDDDYYDALPLMNSLMNRLDEYDE